MTWQQITLRILLWAGAGWLTLAMCIGMASDWLSPITGTLTLWGLLVLGAASIVHHWFRGSS